MKKIFAGIGITIVCILAIVFLFTSCEKKRMVDYYSKEENYITVSGTLTHIHSTDETLCLGFSDITEGFFASADFKFVGENLDIVKQQGIDAKLEEGKTIEFVTAPGCWGDGYIYPIVEITIDGETLLKFEEGFPNFLEYFKKNW
ncbi:MAG: hypothetical protein E7603_10100 [Ruminococcaceae bacterium]|nr:hypothetical protein [Oscillospiraceae bacterium]